MARLEKEYDVIVIGAGINGIACAAYLQKAGLKVACFERRHEAGVHCCTEELMHPGVKVNSCALDVITLGSPAYDELELEKFGLELLTSSEWGLFHPFKKDKSAVLFHSWDARKQYEAWRRISEKDAELLRRLSNYFGARAQEVSSNPYEPVTMEDLLTRAQLISECPDIPSDWINMTGMEMADQMWEDERIKVATLGLGMTFPGMRADERSGNLYPIFLPAIFPSSFFMYTARGGAHALPHAIVRSFVHYGGSYFPNCPVEKIIIENGEAKGITLTKHAMYPEAEIKATRAVVSNVSCEPTFTQFIGLDKMPPETIPGVQAYDYDDDILFYAYYALSEPLVWEGYPPEVERGYGFNVGAERLADVERCMGDFNNGRITDPPMSLVQSTQGFCFADPTQAPPGQYTFEFLCLAPYDPKKPGGPEAWDEIREWYGDKCEDLMMEYTPNLKKAKIARVCETPVGFYRRNPSAVHGSVFQTAFTEAMMDPLNRPFPGCGAPRTPIAKVYLSNSIYPLGATDLAAGRVAASAVAQDTGVREQDWWNVKPIEPGLRVLKERGIEARFTVD